MFTNPFSTIFGGKPGVFFGRKDILARFKAAMVDEGSEDRALFITGNRGSGKTALLEQLTQVAKDNGRKVIDATGESGVSTSKTVHYAVEGDLTAAFLEVARKESHGVFVSVDEVQKIPQHDISLICDAFQMASRKGYDVMLAIAGLPYAHEEVVQYEGCTYMRRAVHEELGLFDPEEVRDAFEEAFGRSKGLEVSSDALGELVSRSFGHPYVMQLLGYHLIAWINGRVQERSYVVTADDVAEAAPLAIAAYERRALKPLLDVMPDEERRYLVAMARVADENRVASTGDVARELGKTTQQASRARQALIGNGTIISVGRGEVMFNVPYLREYITREPDADVNAGKVRRWKL